MKLKIVTSLFTAMIAFSSMALAQTPSSPTTPPPTSPPKEQPSTSNKGGQLRGLDRADQAAGEHGQQGRETARDAQLNRPSPSERSGVPDRPVRPDRPGR
jgi:hypothetical protein